MKGVCLHIWWGKTYVSSIVKFIFLAFLNEYQFLIMFIYEIVSEIIHSTKNTVNCAIIYPFHVISELEVDI